MNIVICATQVPFVRGGAEVHVEGLRDALIEHGHRAEIVALPFKWYPKTEIFKCALAWRLLDLSEANGTKIDLVICTKFPTWAVKHPRKIAWIIHQHRQAYDWFGTPNSDFTNAPDDHVARRRIGELDRRCLSECQQLYSNSSNVAARLKRSTGLDAIPLHVPIRLKGLCPESYGDFIFTISRLDLTKRVDLLLNALALTENPYRTVIAGEGPELDNLRSLSRRLGLEHSVEFVGRVSDEEAVRFYNTARAVYYSPLDEDFGLVALEALTAGKPVLTTADAGGVLELVEHRQTGIVVAEASPDSLSQGLDTLMRDEPLARSLGARGQIRATEIRWDDVVRTLTSHV